jgi:hypothetical protein
MTRTLLLGALLFVAASSSRSQDVAGGGTKTEDTRAFVRGWIINPDGPTSLGAKLGGAAGEVVLNTTGASELAAPSAYLELAPGNTVFELKINESIASSITAGLSPGHYYTALASRAADGRGWELKLLPDGPHGPNVSERPVRIMKYTLGRPAELSFDGGDIRKLAADGWEEFKRPAKVTALTVTVQAEDALGAPAVSSVELDLANAGSAYVLVNPDYRGRMRPSVITGGAPPPTPKPEPTPTPMTPEMVQQHQRNLARMELEHELMTIQIQLRDLALSPADKAKLESRKSELEGRLGR